MTSKQIAALGLCLSSVLFLSACVGPKYVRACNELSYNCDQLLTVCTAMRTERDLLRARIGACEADNARLVNGAAK